MTTSASPRREDLWKLAKPVLIGFGLMLPVLFWLRGWSLYKGTYRHDPLMPAGVQLTVESLRSPVLPTFFIFGLLMLLYHEWRNDRLSRTLIAVGGRRRWLALALLAITGLLVGQILLPGGPSRVDGVIVAQNGWNAFQTLLRGQVPIWTNYASLGYPFGQFSSSLIKIVHALIMIVTAGEAHLAAKLLIFGLHLLSTWLMFVWMKRLTGSKWAGVLAAFAYGLTFYHYKVVVYIGRYHQSLVFVTFPLLLLCVDWLLGDSTRRRWPIGALALCIGLAVWGHVTYGTLGVGLAAGYGVIRLLALEGLSRRERLRRLGRLAAGFALGGLLILPRLIPLMLESGLIYKVGAFVESGFSDGTISIGQVLNFKQNMRSENPYDIYAGYIGLSIVALSLIGLIGGLVRHFRKTLPVAGLLLVGLFLCFGPHYLPFDAIVQAIPFGRMIYAGKSPGLYLVFLIVPVCAFAGLSLDAITAAISRLSQRPCDRIALAQWGMGIAALIALDLFPPTLQAYAYEMPYPPEDIAPAYAWIAGQPADFSRIATGSAGAGFEMPLTGHPGLFLSVEEIPARAGELTRTGRSEIESEIDETGTLSTAGANLAYLMDIGYVAMEGLDSGTPTVSFGEDTIPVMPVDHSPLIASLETYAVSPAREPVEVAGEMEIDGDHHTAEAIPVLYPAESRTLDGSAADLDAAVIDYQIEPQRMSLTYKISQPAFVQIAWACYPYLEVSIDGERIEPVETGLGLIGFWSEGGTHTVSTRPVLSPVRKVTGLLALIGLIAALGSGIADRVKNRKEEPTE
ncbi:MAG: hypothetical protein JXJ17_01200 [Anaerolineae bacterium]|nr:hypothetical protein [Anaerolineae bacterium]